MKMEEAAKIVVDCIRVTGNFTGTIQAQDKLSTVGITTAHRINGLRDRIVTDPNIGVPHFNHSLDEDFLQELSTDWTVIELILVVYNNSVSNTMRAATARAEEALLRVQQ
jgi:hypothetical protein